MKITLFRHPIIYLRWKIFGIYQIKTGGVTITLPSDVKKGTQFTIKKLKDDGKVVTIQP